MDESTLSASTPATLIVLFNRSATTVPVSAMAVRMSLWVHVMLSFLAVGESRSMAFVP